MTGLILGLNNDSLVVKAVCTSIFIAALTPMLFVFCAQLRFFVRLKIKTGRKLTRKQDMMITWLNVWQALMYLRLALSYILLVYLYIRVSQA